MKRIILLVAVLLILTGCKKETIIKKTSSERKQNIINISKKELIKKEYINKNNLKSFSVKKVYLDGYYKNDSNKKYFEIDFKYTCKDNSKDCVKSFHKDDNGNSIVWIYTDFDEKKVYDIKKSISISYEDMNNENYIRVGEIIE